MKTKKFGPFASEVYRIVLDSEGPVTAGEVFAVYRERYPNTNRARNEIAKRVNDLHNAGALELAGRGECPVTGERVQMWRPANQANLGALQFQFSAAPAESGQVVSSLGGDYDCRPVTRQADYEDRRVLVALHAAAVRLIDSRLFRWLAPKKMWMSALSLERALRNF